ncbi:MAG TPA: tetratricopeptide repeat protein [Cyclobacteriaceae bacterium]|nr:tetratricopeptide repeat protein [Cyclobacteriaceae bacterium]
MRKLFSLLLFLSVANLGWSQATGCKNNWPADKAKAEEQLAIYGDAIKQKQYRAAVPGIQWFLKNAPNWNTKLYIDGTEAYNALAAAEKDPAKKQVLVDSLLWLYDERVKNCGDEVNVLNRKATYAAVYNGQNKEKTAEVLALFDKVLEISGTNVSDNVLDTYFKMVFANFALLKNMNDDDVITRYDKIQTAIDKKIAVYQQQNKTAEVEKLKASKAGNDDLLPRMVTVDCNFVKKNMEPKFKANPNDLALAKKIFGFMIVGKCTDEPLWLEAGEVVHKSEKDYGIAKNMAVKYLANGNTKRAEELAKEAVDLAKSGPDKAEALIVVGSIQAKNNANSAARETFKQAAAADPSSKEAWEKIGDLYYNANECKKLESQAQDRLIYIAAYEMYAKAGSNAKMSNAKAAFPSKEEIFLLNWKAGESKPTGCWVGETVTLRTRD